MGRLKKKTSGRPSGALAKYFIEGIIDSLERSDFSPTRKAAVKETLEALTPSLTGTGEQYNTRPVPTPEQPTTQPSRQRGPQSERATPPKPILQEVMKWASHQMAERQRLNAQDMQVVLKEATGTNYLDFTQNAALVAAIMQMAEGNGLRLFFNGIPVGLQYLPTSKTGYFVARSGPGKDDVHYRGPLFPPLTAAPRIQADR